MFLEIIFPISSMLFFYFLKDLKNTKLIPLKKFDHINEATYLVFIKYFVYVLVLINLVFISTIGIHEFSHVIAARLYGCESRSIFYENGQYPYTEIFCDNVKYKPLIIFAGIIFPFIVGLFLYFTKENLLKVVSLMFMGFNFIASFKDINDLGFSGNISWIVTLTGLLFLLYGIYLMIKTRVDQHEHII